MNNKQFEKIEQYLNGELSIDEQRLFESELQINKELASLFNISKSVETQMPGILNVKEEEVLLKQTLQQLNATYFKKELSEELPASNKPAEPQPVKLSEQIPPSTNNKKVVALKLWQGLAAAAVIGVVVTAGIVVYQKNSNSKSQLAGQNIKTNRAQTFTKQDTTRLKENLPPVDVVKNDSRKGGAAESKDNRLLKDKENDHLFALNFKPDLLPEDREGPLEDAFEQYENKKYKNAIATIENADLEAVSRGQLTDAPTLHFYANYYKGLSYLAAKNPTAAITALKEAVAKSPDDMFKTRAQWYLALGYLKTGDLIMTENLLAAIDAGSNTEFKLKAHELLNKLKK